MLWNISHAVFDKPGCSSSSSSALKADPKNDENGHLNPISMKKTHNSNIFCVAFDSKNERIFSGGNDDQVIIHEVAS